MPNSILSQKKKTEGWWNTYNPTTKLASTTNTGWYKPPVQSTTAPTQGKSFAETGYKLTGNYWMDILHWRDLSDEQRVQLSTYAPHRFGPTSPISGGNIRLGYWEKRRNPYIYQRRPNAPPVAPTQPEKPEGQPGWFYQLVNLRI